MSEADHRDAAAIFDPLRPRLMRVAYRMLGSVADAEDVVQEAFIRWTGASRSEVREPEAFLRRTVTRLCLDQLKSPMRILSPGCSGCGPRSGPERPTSARGFRSRLSRRMRKGKRTSPCR